MVSSALAVVGEPVVAGGGAEEAARLVGERGQMLEEAVRRGCGAAGKQNRVPG